MTTTAVDPERARAAFLTLKKKVEDEGLDAATPLLSLAVLGFHMSCLFGGLAPLVLGGWSVWAVLGLVVSTYGCLGIATSGHVASHHTFTGHRGWDRFFTFFGFTFLLGVSEHFWRQKHVRIHHAHPNHVGLDNDIDLRPFFTITQTEFDAARGFKRWLFERQHWLIVPALAFNAMNVQRESWGFLARAFWKRPTALELWADIAFLAGHFTLWIGIPCLFFSPVDVVGVYLLRKVLMGFAMFSAFAPAHFPVEAEIVAGPAAETDHVTRQLYTTVNFRTGLLGRIVCSGVDFQIEHHLLPTANQYKFHKLAPHVQAFCREQGFPYHSYSWWGGIMESLRAFRVPKRVVPVESITRIDGPTADTRIATPELDPSY